MLLNLVNRKSSERKFKKNLVIQVWVLWRSSRGRSENVLGTSRINVLGTSLELQIETSLGRHFRTSPGRQIGTSPGCQIRMYVGRSNRIFRGRSGDVGGGRPWDVLGTNICRLSICHRAWLVLDKSPYPSLFNLFLFLFWFCFS